MLRSTSLRLHLLGAVVLASAASSAVAGLIYAGPAYTSGAGYLPQPIFDGFNVGDTAGNGVGVGRVEKFPSINGTQGARAVRWGPTGVTELATRGTGPGGYTNSGAFAVNASGVSVGYAQEYYEGTSLGERAVRWGATGNTVSILNSLTPYSSSRAFAVNDAGAAAGTSMRGEAPYGYRAVRWSATSSAATELGVIGLDSSEGTFATANSINTRNDVAGFASKYDDAHVALGYRAVRWLGTGTAATELGVIGTDANGKTTSQGFAINDDGTVIGFARKFDANHLDLGERAIRWDAGQSAATELGTLGVSNGGVGSSRAFAINKAGVSVGQSAKYVNGQTFQTKAVRWNAGATQAIDLDDLNGIVSAATDINAIGAAAGYSNGATNRAIVWTPAGTPVDLNTRLPAGSGWATLFRAENISDTGWVTGRGRFDPDGAGGVQDYERLFLTLVPEAGTYGRGDANFDTKVNFDDLVILAQHYNSSNAALATNVGDLNLDGVVNFDDLVPLTQNYNKALGSALVVADASFAADWALAQALVPEPTTVLLAIAVSLAPAARRRR